MRRSRGEISIILIGFTSNPSNLWQQYLTWTKHKRPLESCKCKLRRRPVCSGNCFSTWETWQAFSTANSKSLASWHFELKSLPRNEVSKIFIISLYLKIERTKDKVLDLTGPTVEYGPLNWPIAACILSKRYNNIPYELLCELSGMV